jgi:hypothetical protein
MKNINILHFNLCILNDCGLEQKLCNVLKTVEKLWQYEVSPSFLGGGGGALWVGVVWDKPLPIWTLP